MRWGLRRHVSSLQAPNKFMHSSVSGFYTPVIGLASSKVSSCNACLKTGLFFQLKLFCWYKGVENETVICTDYSSLKKYYLYAVIMIKWNNCYNTIIWKLKVSNYQLECVSFDSRLCHNKFLSTDRLIEGSVVMLITSELSIALFGFRHLPIFLRFPVFFFIVSKLVLFYFNMLNASESLFSSNAKLLNAKILLLWDWKCEFLDFKMLCSKRGNSLIFYRC